MSIRNAARFWGGVFSLGASGALFWVTNASNPGVNFVAVVLGIIGFFNFFILTIKD